MDAYALHLAVAALVGASVVAVSAYYMHRKTLSQVLDFARAVERERDRRRGAAVEGEEEEPRRRRRGQYGPRCKSPGYYRRVGGSASLPDVTAAADTDGEEEDEALEEQQPLTNGPFLVEEDQKGYPIPAGLPRLQTVPEGNKQSKYAAPNKRSGHIIRSTSPKSSVHSALGSQDGSEEDDNMENDAKLDDAYVHTNGHFIMSHLCLQAFCCLQMTCVLQVHLRTADFTFQIGSILIIDEPFTIDNGLLTPTMKIRRDKVVERYREQIEKLYN